MIRSSICSNRRICRILSGMLVHLCVTFRKHTQCLCKFNGVPAQIVSINSNTGVRQHLSYLRKHLSDVRCEDFCKQSICLVIEQEKFKTESSDRVPGGSKMSANKSTRAMFQKRKPACFLWTLVAFGLGEIYGGAAGTLWRDLWWDPMGPDDCPSNGKPRERERERET